MNAVTEPAAAPLSEAAEELAERAMMLPHAERQALAERIRTMSPALPPGFTKEAQRAELDRRLERYRSGEDPGRPLEDVFTELDELIEGWEREERPVKRGAA